MSCQMYEWLTFGVIGIALNKERPFPDDPLANLGWLIQMRSFKWVELDGRVVGWVV